MLLPGSFIFRPLGSFNAKRGQSEQNPNSELILTQLMHGLWPDRKVEIVGFEKNT